MTPLSEDQVARVLATAVSELGVTEDPPGSNAGKRVEEYQRVVGLKKGAPWCAAFFAWCGVQVLAKDWPVPLVGGCASLGDWARKNAVLVYRPQVGDAFLLHFPKLGRFAHVGLITEAQDAEGKYGTVEGNTSGGGSREGWGVFRQRRAWKPEDAFIRLGA